MSKGNRKYNAKSALVIKQLAAKHQVTEAFVRLAVKGERGSQTAETLHKEYRKLINAIDNALK